MVQFDVDWRKILLRAAQQGLAPLIYANLKRLSGRVDVPAEVREQFKRLYYWYLAQNTGLYLKLGKILAVFAEAGIPVVVLKGAALAELVYRDIALRPMVDVDLLVKRNDLDTATRLLEGLGYVGDESDHPKNWYQEHHHHLAPYFAPDRSLILELHHHIVRPGGSVRIPIDDLWRRARAARIAGRIALVFAPEDLLLHTCLHLSHDNRFRGMLRALCDIAETSKRYETELEWDRLVETAREYGVEKHLYYALWLARELLGAEYPASVLTSLGSSVRRRSLADRTLRLIIRRAVLSQNPTMPLFLVGAIYDTGAELLGSEKVGNTIGILLRHLARGLVRSARGAPPRIVRLVRSIGPSSIPCPSSRE